MEYNIEFKIAFYSKKSNISETILRGRILFIYRNHGVNTFCSGEEKKLFKKEKLTFL